MEYPHCEIHDRDKLRCDVCHEFYCPNCGPHPCKPTGGGTISLVKATHSSSSSTKATGGQVSACPFLTPIFGDVLGILNKGGTLGVEDIQGMLQNLMQNADIIRQLGKKGFAQFVASLQEALGCEPLTMPWTCESLYTAEGSEDKIKSPKQGLSSVVGAALEFATGVRNMCETFEYEQKTQITSKVYFMRDGFWPMAADNFLSGLGGEQPNACPAMVSRSTVGIELFDGTVTPMMIKASTNSKNNRATFIKELKQSIETSKDVEFLASCDRLINHLLSVGAIKGDGSNQHVVFIDTGYKTFPAFMKALIEVRMPAIKVSMFYHTVKAGFDCLPHMNIRKEGEPDNEAFAGLNDVGSYATFFRSGAQMTPQGQLTNLQHGDKKRVFHSLLFGVMLLKHAINQTDEQNQTSTTTTSDDTRSGKQEKDNSEDGSRG